MYLAALPVRRPGAALVLRRPAAAPAAPPVDYIGAAIARARALPVETTQVNPYPHGVSVAHTGPNDTATYWPLAFYPDLGVWVANTGFGIAPIFKDGEMPFFLDLTQQLPWEGSGIVSYPVRNHGNHRFLRRLDGSGESAEGVPGLLHLLVILTADGGQQRVWYRKDFSGYWIPSTAQGVGKKTGSLWDTLLIVGAVIVASVVTYGAATGWFAAAGATTAAGGAAAGGAEAAAAGAGLVETGTAVGAVAPEIAAFTPAALAPTATITAADLATMAPLDIAASAAAPAAGIFGTGLSPSQAVSLAQTAAKGIATGKVSPLDIAGAVVNVAPVAGVDLTLPGGIAPSTALGVGGAVQQYLNRQTPTIFQPAPMGPPAAAPGAYPSWLTQAGASYPAPGAAAPVGPSAPVAPIALTQGQLLTYGGLGLAALLLLALVT